MQIFNNAGQDQAQKIQKDAAQFIPAETMPSTFPYVLFSQIFGMFYVRYANAESQKHQKISSNIISSVMLYKTQSLRCRS